MLSPELRRGAQRTPFLLSACGALLLGAALAPPCAVLAAETAPQAAAAHDPHDLAADWQGTLQTPQKSFRVLLRVSKAPKGWTGKLYSLDQGATPLEATVTEDGNAVTWDVALAGVTYKGVLAPDGNTITGNWNQGQPLPLNLVRATKETAWEIPAAAAPPRQMAADADPAFDVATIKPNNSGDPGMKGLTVNGRDFKTVNSSLADLMSFAYQVQKKQIVGAPDWIDKDRYDISAVPDTEGSPNVVQLRLMLRKLLAERFQLKFHQDKRELSAYVLTVAKTGSRLKPTQINGPLPGLGFRPSPGGLTFVAANAQISDVTSIFQTLLFDRPVVDRTGLTGKYDITLPFTPDDTEFGGHPPPLPARPEGTEAAPPLFEAIQTQLGLKLDAEKTAVDVLAIDHVEKPTAN